MPKIGSLIEKLLKKVEVDTTAEDLKAILALDAEIPDEAFGKLDKGLMTVKAATSNAEVIKVVRKEVLDAADQEIDKTVTELGLYPGEDFAKEQSTYKKIAALAKLAKDAGEKAQKPGAKATADEWAVKEAAYNKQIKDLKDSMTTKETEFATTRESDITSFELQKKLLPKNYAFPKEMDPEVKLMTALATVKNELAKKGFTIKRGEGGSLVVVDKEGRPAYSEANEALSADGFIDGALARNKLLQINDPGQQQQQQQPGQQGQQPGNVPFGQQKGNLAIVKELETQLAEMK